MVDVEQHISSLCHSFSSHHGLGSGLAPKTATKGKFPRKISEMTVAVSFTNNAVCDFETTSSNHIVSMMDDGISLTRN